MKNVLKCSVLVLLLVTSLRMEAAEGIDVKVTEDRFLMVELQNVAKGSVLYLQDRNGEILFKDSLVINGQYKKAFNLEVIPNGIYFLLLEKVDCTITTEVTKTKEGLELTGKSSKIAFKPTIKVEETRVKIFLTNPEEKTAYLRVYDKWGVLMTTVNCRDTVVNRTLDFSQVPAGEYNIEIFLGNRTYKRKIDVG